MVRLKMVPSVAAVLHVERWGRVAAGGSSAAWRERGAAEQDVSYPQRREERGWTKGKGQKKGPKRRWRNGLRILA